MSITVALVAQLIIILVNDTKMCRAESACHSLELESKKETGTKLKKFKEQRKGVRKFLLL